MGRQAPGAGLCRGQGQRLPLSLSKFPHLGGSSEEGALTPPPPAPGAAGHAGAPLLLPNLLVELETRAPPSPTLTLTLQPASHPLHQGHKLWMIFLLSAINKLTTGVDLPAGRQQGGRVGGSPHEKPTPVGPGAARGPRPAAHAAQKAAGSSGGPGDRGRRRGSDNHRALFLLSGQSLFPTEVLFLPFFPPS